MLHSQLLDLEHRFRLLQEEKNRAEQEAREREDITYKKNDSIQSDTRLLQAAIDEKQKQLKDLAAELGSLKELAGDKGDEIARLKHEMDDFAGRNEALEKDRKALEAELALESDQKRAAQIEADRIAELNSRLSKDESAVASRHKDNLVEAQQLSVRIDDVNRQITDTLAIKRQKETEIDATLGAEKDAEREVESYEAENAKLGMDNRGLRQRADEIAAQVARLNQRLSDTLALTDARDKELRNAKAGLNYSEAKVSDISQEINKFQRDNSILQSLLDKYRGDVSVQKRLREDEMAKKLAAEQEKKLLEREVLNKELETRTVKKELEKVQVSHEMLVGSHYQLGQELDALKDHAELLESQNKNLHRELDSFVATDEKVCVDLDRKSRVDYLKAKNEDEVQRSAAKVRTSQSPARSPYKSPYKR